MPRGRPSSAAGLRRAGGGPAATDCRRQRHLRAASRRLRRRHHRGVVAAVDLLWAERRREAGRAIRTRQDVQHRHRAARRSEPGPRQSARHGGGGRAPHPRSPPSQDRVSRGNPGEPGSQGSSPGLPERAGTPWHCFRSSPDGCGLLPHQLGQDGHGGDPGARCGDRQRRRGERRDGDRRHRCPAQAGPARAPGHSRDRLRRSHAGASRKPAPDDRRATVRPGRGLGGACDRGAIGRSEVACAHRVRGAVRPPPILRVWLRSVPAGCASRAPALSRPARDP